ncbi:MAG: PAS domain-containing protein, partial [Pseudomonadota bacterium]|nr:PAS domain-containing protein [Pseudomonadota bacterium]
MRLTAALIQMGSNRARDETLYGELERDRLAVLCTEAADVAKHHHAEIFAQQARFDELQRRFFDSNVAAIFLDAATRIQFFTPAISQFFHLIKTDLGRPVTDLLNSDADPSVASAARRVAEGKAVAAVQVQTADGTWYRRRASAYRNENGRIDGVILTFEDITDIKRDCMRLEQSRRQSVRNAAADQRHTAEVGHCLRQPLLALTLLREKLSKRARSTEDRVLVEQLRMQLCSISDMVDSLTNSDAVHVDAANHLNANTATPSIASPSLPMSDMAYCDNHVQQFSQAHSDLVLILAHDGNFPAHLVQALNATGYQVTIARSPSSITGMTQHGAAIPDIGVIDLDALDSCERVFANELRDRIGTMLPLLFLTNDVSLCASDQTAYT